MPEKDVHKMTLRLYPDSDGTHPRHKLSVIAASKRQGERKDSAGIIADLVDREFQRVRRRAGK